MLKSEKELRKKLEELEEKVEGAHKLNEYLFEELEEIRSWIDRILEKKSK